MQETLFRHKRASAQSAIDDMEALERVVWVRGIVEKERESE